MQNAHKAQYPGSVCRLAAIVRIRGGDNQYWNSTEYQKMKLSNKRRSMFLDFHNFITISRKIASYVSLENDFLRGPYLF